jgi:cyclophilin family peptidyl-prolyl cis-trans isomerase
MKLRTPALVAGVVVLLSGCGGGHHAKKPDVNGCVPVQPVSTSGRTRPKPTTKLDLAKTYDVTFATNCGQFTVRLDPQQSPNASASVASLAQSGFYDGTTFFKIVPTYAQGGDPTATGTGGPGYTTVDSPPPNARYTHGVVAMAKTGAQPPGTAGSQFFVVTAADAGLTPDYAIVGTVIQGLDVVDRIGKLGGPGGRPTETAEIQHASLASFK